MTNFKEIVGHDDIISHLRNAIKMNRVSHAYIIEGEEGIGKKLLAGIFAKTLQCEAKGDEPCDVCTSCLNFESGNHPDIHYVKPTKKASIGVDDIREQLNMDIYVKPYQYPYKIYIVQDADTMTVQAQNALLKTIEEPPHYAIILLIAGNSSMFLPTVLSRCVILSLKQIEESKIEKYLAQHDHISPEQAKMFASFSRGNIGKAKMLLASETFESIRNDVIKTIDCVIENNDFELMEMVKKLCEDKDRGAMILDFMLTWLRDLMLIKKIPEEKYMIHKDKYKTLLKQGEGLAYNRISALIEEIEATQRNMRVNVNYQLSLETMLFQIEERSTRSTNEHMS